MIKASATSSSYFLLSTYLLFLRTFFEKVRFCRVLHIFHKYHKDIYPCYIYIIYKYIIFWNHQLPQKYILLKTPTKMQIPPAKLCCSCSKGDDFFWKRYFTLNMSPSINKCIVPSPINSLNYDNEISGNLKI